MTTITYLGGEETGDRGTLPWGRFVFELNKPVPCDDPHIIKKARTNRFFKVEEDPAMFTREGIPRKTPLRSKQIATPTELPTESPADEEVI